MVDDDHRGDTRKRILDVASKAFADGGYNGTSVRHIVAMAGTNVASVNYHFGSKEALYKAVLDATIAKATADMGMSMDATQPSTEPTVDTVHAYAVARILKGLGAGNIGPPRLLGWEIISPKIGLRSLIDTRLAAAERQLVGLLAPLFGDGVTEEQKAFAARWFFVTTFPPPPVAAAMRKMMGADASQAVQKRAAVQLADAAVAGVRALTAAPISGD